MNRRQFLRTSAATSLAAATFGSSARAWGAGRPSSAKITRVSVQVANGKRLTPVAPNAYAPYRGFGVSEPVLRIRTADGLEGIGRQVGKPDVLKQLVGMDPFALFDWDGGVIRGPAAAHAKLMAELYGCDVALLDLVGKAIRKPVADLLGTRVRESVDVYDSCLYMEDLLKPEER
jgi:L-alanine-DL-glutamate epimerase-like enolase superfamily enzyme